MERKRIFNVSQPATKTSQFTGYYSIWRFIQHPDTISNLTLVDIDLSSSAQHNHIALYKKYLFLSSLFGGDGIHVRSLEVCETDKMENRLGEDGGEWGRINVANQMCNCGLWLNLIFLRDRLIRKVFRLPADDALSIYIQL